MVYPILLYQIYNVRNFKVYLQLVGAREKTDSLATSPHILFTHT